MLNELNESVIQMWEAYLKTLGETSENTDKNYESWHFCNNEKDANELAELVLNGVKRATASLYESYEFENEQIPAVGDHIIITNWDGIAQCVIKATKITTIPFKDVTEEFAAREGEGDKSLEYWREGHWRFFTEDMKIMGRKPHEDMLIICEEFEVVYK